MGEQSKTLLPLRLMKLAVLFLLIGITIWQCVKNIQDYLKYESTTAVIKEAADSIEFPLITICNYNRWKQSLIPAAAYAAAVRAYEKANGGGSTPVNVTTGTPIDIYNFTYENGWHLIDSANAAQFSKNRSSTLGYCTFAGGDCNTKFFRHRMTSYGNCYTFNQDLTQEDIAGTGVLNSETSLPLKQTHASESNGLELYVNIEAWDYSEILQTDGKPHVGLKVIVHSKDDEPDPTVSGVAIGPGFYGTISIRRSEYINLEPPWGFCNREAKLSYFDTYTTSTCETECKMDVTEKNCSCQPYFYPKISKMCNIEDTLGCAANVIDKINKDFSKYCTCPESCTYEEYSTSVSYVPFPSTPIGYQIMALTGIPSITFMKENLVGIRIYFSDLGTTIMTQSQAHTVISTLNDIGGASGLYVGFSVMTIVDLITVIVELVQEHFKTKKNSIGSASASAKSIRKEAFQ